MKTRFALLGIALLAMAYSAFGGVYTITMPGGNIPDNHNPEGSVLTVNFNVTGVVGNISKVTLALNNFAGDYMYHCRVNLATSGGPAIRLFDGVGPSLPNGTFIFDQSASTAFSNAASPSGGIYKPQADSLSVFNGRTQSQANVTWSVTALAWNGDILNHFDSATLEITTAVPEPSHTAIIGVIGMMGFFSLRHLRGRKNSAAI